MTNKWIFMGIIWIVCFILAITIGTLIRNNQELKEDVQWYQKDRENLYSLYDNILDTGQFVEFNEKYSNDSYENRVHYKDMGYYFFESKGNYIISFKSENNTLYSISYFEDASSENISEFFLEIVDMDNEGVVKNIDTKEGWVEECVFQVEGEQ